MGQEIKKTFSYVKYRYENGKWKITDGKDFYSRAKSPVWVARQAALVCGRVDDRDIVVVHGRYWKNPDVEVYALWCPMINVYNGSDSEDGRLPQDFAELLKRMRRMVEGRFE